MVRSRRRAPGRSSHPVKYLSYEVHGRVRMQEREPGDRLALPHRRGSERDLVAEQLVGPAGVLLRGPALAVEEDDTQLRFPDQLEVVTRRDLGGRLSG